MWQRMAKPLFAAVALLCAVLWWHCASSGSRVRFGEHSGSTTRAEATPRMLWEEEAASLEMARMRRVINSYLGVPYRWGGMSRSGMDCSGFVKVVYRQALEVALPRQTDEMYAEGWPVARSELVFGDLVFFENVEQRGVSHVGVYLGDNEFVHASTTGGVVVSSLDEPYYRVRYVGARRVYAER